MPTVPDGSPAMPRGIAIKYRLPGGSVTDMVTTRSSSSRWGPERTFVICCRRSLRATRCPTPNKVEQFSAAIRMRRGDRFAPDPGTALPTRVPRIDAFIFVNRAAKGRRYAT